MACSHLVQAPFCLNPTTWLARSFSASVLTSFWTSSCISLPFRLLKWVSRMLPNPARLITTDPTSAQWQSFDSAWSTISCAFHFLLVLTSMPAWKSLGSLDSLYWTPSFHGWPWTFHRRCWWAESAYWSCHRGQCYSGLWAIPTIFWGGCGPSSQTLPQWTAGIHIPAMATATWKGHRANKSRLWIFLVGLIRQ